MASRKGLESGDCFVSLVEFIVREAIKVSPGLSGAHALLGLAA